MIGRIDSIKRWMDSKQEPFDDAKVAGENAEVLFRFKNEPEREIKIGSKFYGRDELLVVWSLLNDGVEIKVDGEPLTFNEIHRIIHLL